MKSPLFSLLLILLVGLTFSPARAQITWGSLQHMSGTTDVSTTGTLVDAATFNSAAETVNGVTFNPMSASGTIGGYTGYTDASTKISANSPGNTPGVYGSTFSTASPSSAAYSAAVSTLAFGYYQNGTVVLSGLTSGHTYQVQVWSYYSGAGGTANTTFTGTNTVTLAPDAGEFAIGTFTASASSLTFNYNYGTYYGILSAISLRDTTSAGSAPVITSALTASGTVGTAFNYQITASNTPTSFSASGLPAGLAVNSGTGGISGTPTVSGTSSVVIGATNASGTGTATLTLTIAAAGSAPSITSSTSASGTVGTAFNYQITASNSPTSFSATGLPSGLSVSTTTGAITGTPTASGTSSVTIGATNSYGTGSATLTVTISAAGTSQITWGSAQHMSGTTDVSTTGTLVDAATFNSTSETVNGVTFNPMAASGTIAGSTGYTDASTKISANSPGGSPGAYGTAFTTASPSSAAYSAATATLAFGYFQNGTIVLSGLTSGHSYQVQVWSDYTGSPGNCNTTFTGANTVTLVPDAGEYAIGTFTASATSLTFNYNYGNDYGILSAICLRDTTSGGSAPVITSSTSASGTVGSAFNYQITASNTPTSFSATGLPAGLSVSTTTGAITGTPSASGTSSVTIGATNAYGTGNATLTVTIAAAGSAPSITSSTTASGTVGTTFNYQITASNSPTSFSATGLPAGLSVSTTTGAITGTPTASGTSSVTIGAMNAYGTGNATLTLTVSAAGGSGQITWGALQNMSGTTDVSTTGSFVDAATFYSTAETVNGVTFNPLSSSGTINGYTGYTDSSTKISANSPGGSPGAYGTLYTTASPSSAAYSAAVSTIGFGYYQNGTVVLSGLTSGHSYQVQVWSYYTGAAGNCNTTFTGANTVTLVPGSGEFAIGTFTASSTSLTFNFNYASQYSVLSAVSLRDTTSGGSAPVITSSSTASGTVGTAFNYQITASNSPTSFSATGLPAGLSVSTTTGAITGTPTASGTSTVTLCATNASGTGNLTLTLTVAAAGSPPSITSSSTASGTVGSAFNYQITASNSPTSFSASGLPSGLSVSTTTGAITGTPTASGTSTVTLGATNAYGTGNLTLTLTVSATGSAPVISSSTSASGTVGLAFSYQITASNGPTSYSATGLPSGLSVNTGTGTITGTPQATGTTSVIIGATNASGTGTATLTLSVPNCAVAITNGTGTGNYAPGSVVSITANAAPSGYQFAGWSYGFNGNGTITNPSAASTTFTVGTSVATITATYTPSSGTSYALTVSGGSGSGSYLPGTIVTVTAATPPTGSQFSRWLGTNSVLVTGDADSTTTNITMPSAATTITASYTPILTTYAVTVNGGVINNDTGSGHYPAGTVLSVTANTPGSGTNFTGWTDSSHALANAAFSTTTLTVPSAAVTVTANTATTTATYALTVSGGAGSGTYAPGTPVTVTAAAPASGMQFAGWTGSTSGLSNAASPITTFNTGSAAATITANYTSISSVGTLILAVGLEKIVSGYTGPLIRIQRPSDNTQMDIYAASGSTALNTATVSTFLGQTQGWITTLYAQDGSGNNVTTPLPLSTATMPTISVTDPTGVTINGTANPTARNVEQEFQNTLQGSSRYFVIPSSVTINKAQASAFLALRPDFSGSGEGDPFMSLYEVGTLPLPPGSTGAPATYPSSADAFDLISTGGGLQGLTHVTYTTSGSTTTANPTESFSGGNIAERSQQTVVGLVTSPGSAPLIYLDGVSHSSGGTAPASANCSGGYLLAGVGTGYFYGIPLFANYNFLGFALYSGTVSSSTAASISSTMLPRAVPAFNIVASGDSITQGTGSIDGWNTLHYAEPLLNHPADITNTAVEGSVTAGALGDTNYPTIATSLIGNLYNSSYTKNIYYLASGTNDLHEASTGAAAWANDMQALENAKSLGFKTVVATVMHEYGETAAQATEVNNFNTLARAAVGSSYLDAIVDYAADVRLGNSGIYYPAYSGDGTHPNEAGYQVMGTIAAPVFNSIIGP